MKRLCLFTFAILLLFAVASCSNNAQDISLSSGSQDTSITETDPLTPQLVYDPDIIPYDEENEMRFIDLPRRNDYQKYPSVVEDYKYIATRVPGKTKEFVPSLASLGAPIIDGLLNISDIIIEGEVVGEGEVRYVDVATGTPVDDKIKGITGGSLPAWELVYHNIKIDKVLWNGNAERKLEPVIEFYQFSAENQVKDGDKAVFMLADMKKLGYVGVCNEWGTFMIGEDNKITARSSLKSLSKFDGITVDEFEVKITDMLNEYFYAIPYDEYLGREK